AAGIQGADGYRLAAQCMDGVAVGVVLRLLVGNMLVEEKVLGSHQSNARHPGLHTALELDRQLGIAVDLEGLAVGGAGRAREKALEFAAVALAARLFFGVVTLEAVVGIDQNGAVV